MFEKLNGRLIITTIIKFAFVFVYFAINFLALAISIQCNRNKSVIYRTAVGIYAFMLGFVYLFVNYYGYRVKTLGEVCEIDTTRLFS